MKKNKKCSKCKINKNVKEFYLRPERKKGKGIRSICKSCDSKRKSIYYATEEGFMKKLFASINDRKVSTRRHIGHSVDFTQKEFFEIWKEYKKQYGMFCFYTGIPINFIKSPEHIRGNQVSVDRIDNSKGYSRNNIIFCSSKANFMKASVTIDMCRKIVALYEERQGIDKTQKMNTMKGYESISSYRTAPYLNR